jgi:hypothetical protein
MLEARCIRGLSIDLDSQLLPELGCDVRGRILCSTAKPNLIRLNCVNNYGAFLPLIHQDAQRCAKNKNSILRSLATNCSRSTRIPAGGDVLPDRSHASAVALLLDPRKPGPRAKG